MMRVYDPGLVKHGLKPISRSFKPVGAMGFSWSDGDILVVSTLDVVEEFNGWVDVDQWHISVTSWGYKRRATNQECKRALKAFGMIGAEEDNHRPLMARHFWLCVDESKRVACECKDGEHTIVEPDGFKWQLDDLSKLEAIREECIRIRKEVGAALSFDAYLTIGKASRF